MLREWKAARAEKAGSAVPAQAVADLADKQAAELEEIRRQCAALEQRTADAERDLTVARQQAADGRVDKPPCPAARGMRLPPPLGPQHAYRLARAVRRSRAGLPGLDAGQSAQDRFCAKRARLCSAARTAAAQTDSIQGGNRVWRGPRPCRLGLLRPRQLGAGVPERGRRQPAGASKGVRPPSLRPPAGWRVGE